MSDIYELIRNFDIDSYLSDHGATQIQANEYALTCPICGKENKLIVNITKKTWHCWVCEEYGFNSEGKRIPLVGAGGIISLIQLLDNCSKQHVLTLLKTEGFFGAVDINKLDLVLIDQIISNDLEASAISPPDYWAPITTELPYMTKRGITVEDARNFGLSYCYMGRYANRLIFPVWENGKLVYYQGRAMYEAVPGSKFIKSLNPPKQANSAVSSEVLMNLDTAKKFERVAIVEGPIDCVHTGLDSVCTFGKKISFVQILKLVLAGIKKIDFMWDGPSATEPYGALHEMIQASNLMSGLFEDIKIILLPQNDPGVYDRVELQEFRNNMCAKAAKQFSSLAYI